MAKNKITLDVLADISRKVNKGVNTNTKNRNKKYNKKALVVFTGSNIEIRNRIEELKELDIDFSLAFSFMSEKILDTDYIINTLNPVEIYREEDIFDLEEVSAEYSYIVGPNITMNTLSKISLGMIDSLVSNFIWTFLYKGKKVYLDYTSVTHYLGERSKNRAVSQVIDNHINILTDMGAVEIGEGTYVNRITGKEKSRSINSNITVENNYNQVIDTPKIITENDLVNQYSNSKSMTFPKGTIITPLARDKARELKIEINIDR